MKQGKDRGLWIWSKWRLFEMIIFSFFKHCILGSRLDLEIKDNCVKMINIQANNWPKHCIPFPGIATNSNWEHFTCKYMIERILLFKKGRECSSVCILYVCVCKHLGKLQTLTITYIVHVKSNKSWYSRKYFQITVG